MIKNVRFLDGIYLQAAFCASVFCTIMLYAYCASFEVLYPPASFKERLQSWVFQWSSYVPKSLPTFCRNQDGQDAHPLKLVGQVTVSFSWDFTKSMEFHGIFTVKWRFRINSSELPLINDLIRIPAPTGNSSPVLQFVTAYKLAT